MQLRVRGRLEAGGSARPRWTKAEIAILKRMYKTRSNAEIAKVLGRKVSSVVFKGHRLGLAKGMKRLKETGRENISRRWRGSDRKTVSARKERAR